MTRLALTLGAVLAAGMAGSASAQTKVKFEGCAAQWVSYCTMINPVGASYVVNSAKPAVPVGKPIILTGTAVTGPTVCGVPALINIKWKLSRKKTCT